MTRPWNSYRENAAQEEADRRADRERDATQPTWRSLAARARRLGVTIDRGPHGVSVAHADVGRVEVMRAASWLGGPRDQADSIILRTAVAAALEQLEER